MQAELSKTQLSHVRFISPESLPEILQYEVQSGRIRGYKVKVTRNVPSQEKIVRKREKVAAILAPVS